jgi:hypothetical protein
MPVFAGIRQLKSRPRERERGGRSRARSGMIQGLAGPPGFYKPADRHDHKLHRAQWRKVNQNINDAAWELAYPETTLDGVEA